VEAPLSPIQQRAAQIIAPPLSNRKLGRMMEQLGLEDHTFELRFSRNNT
jgi:hypothetical protein